MEALIRNVRYAIRMLARKPAFTAIVVLTLALGIGANSAVFSAIDAVLLRPLPFPDADRLVHLTQEGVPDPNIHPPRLQDWNGLSATFQAIAGYRTDDVSDTTTDLPERVLRANVTPRFLDVLGVAPTLGRGFADAEHSLGGPRAVLISDRYWRNRFGADPSVLDETIRVGDQSYPVIGVMPASFSFPDRDVDLWFPDYVDAPWAQSRGGVGWYSGVGRLEPGITIDQARVDLAVVQARLAEQYPDTDRDIGVRIDALKNIVVGSAGGSLWLLFGAVSVLLLIACTNIAALLLSRAAQREQEIAIRYSLGASRTGVAGQTLTEAAVLAFAGAAMGLLVAGGTIAVLRALAPDLPRLGEVAIDGRILMYTTASAVVVALLCGLLPAIRSARDNAFLSRSGRTQVSPRHSLQWLLVGVQVALSVTLLAAAGLLLRSLEALSRVDPGFDAARVLTFHVSGSYDELGDYDRVVQRINGTLDELGALAGVEVAATSWALPGVGTRNQEEFELLEGRADSDQRMIAERRMVSPGYFETMRIPLLSGELCRRKPNGAARTGSTIDVMINRSFADRYLLGRAVIGLHLTNPASIFRSGRITGVVGDARELGVDRDPVPTVYACDSVPHPFPWFLLRTRGEPMAAAGAVRLKINELEPLRSVYDIATLEERIGDAYAQNRLRTVLLVVFAVTALSLACLGVYGTLSYIVSLRRREVGLRVALGALSRNIVAQFLRKALTVVGVACLVGLALSFAFSRALTSMLYGVSLSDPLTLSAVVLLVVGVATLAAILPAVRASRIDPMQALREE